MYKVKKISKNKNINKNDEEDKNENFIIIIEHGKFIIEL
jgi:hypothetical protein